MTREAPRDRPSQYDGTQFLVHVNLPPRDWTTAELYEHVSGVRPNDGAKPWPYYRDARTRQWWSLSMPTDAPVDALVWMIDLDQLAYKSREDARAFLEAVLPELAARAGRLGGSAEPEGSAAEALAKMDRVREMLRVRDYQVTIVVAAPRGSAYRVDEWWQALEGVGLEYGDGNLFWRYNEAFTEDGPEPAELFCAEPYSLPGYFHAGNLGRDVRFPDVALHFRARDVPDPAALLHQMAETARRLAEKLGATLLTGTGQPFDLARAEGELEQALKQLRSLQWAP